MNLQKVIIKHIALNVMWGGGGGVVLFGYVLSTSLEDSINFEALCSLAMLLLDWFHMYTYTALPLPKFKVLNFHTLIFYHTQHKFLCRQYAHGKDVVYVFKLG